MAPRLLKRQALRTRNGLAHLAGLKRPEVAQTPRDLVWRRETARLWRYRSDDRSVHAPLLIVHSLVSKSYILDLQPENSMIRYLVGEGFDVYLLDWEPARPRRRREHARDVRRRVPDPGRGVAATAAPTS